MLANEGSAAPVFVFLTPLEKKWISTMKRETAMAGIHGIGFLPQLFPSHPLHYSQMTTLSLGHVSIKPVQS